MNEWVRHTHTHTHHTYNHMRRHMDTTLLTGTQVQVYTNAIYHRIIVRSNYSLLFFFIEMYIFNITKKRENKNSIQQQIIRSGGRTTHSNKMRLSQWEMMMMLVIFFHLNLQFSLWIRVYRCEDVDASDDT